MLLKHMALTLLSFCAGTAVSAGSFAFLIVIGVIPRLLRRAEINDKIILVENIIILGIIFGCIMSLWERPVMELSAMDSPAKLGSCFGHILITIYGISAGIFVGGIAVSLAEILHTFPIMFRRFNLNEGLSWLMCAMAAGKLCGALFSFCGGYWY